MKLAEGKRSDDDDTTKVRVMIQRVIHEVGGGSSYPTLTKTNYFDWALLMKVKLKTWALWRVIENGGADQQEEMMALDALCGAVPPEMVLTITKKETAKAVWDAITTMRVDDDRVKKATAQQLRQKFDLTMFDDDETVEDYALRLSGMAAHLATLGEEVKDGDIVAKMFQSLPPRFKKITITIKILLDVSTIFVADLTGQSKEARRHLRKRRHRCSSTGSCTSPRRSETREGRSVRWRTTPAAVQEAVALHHAGR
jgi:hypothetical protein